MQTVSNVCLKRTGLLDTCAFSASVLDDNRAVYFRSDVVFGHQILLSWLIDWVEGHTRHKIGHPTQCLGFVLNIAFGKKHKSTHTHTQLSIRVRLSSRRISYEPAGNRRRKTVVDSNQTISMSRSRWTIMTNASPVCGNGSRSALGFSSWTPQMHAGMPSASSIIARFVLTPTVVCCNMLHWLNALKV